MRVIHERVVSTTIGHIYPWGIGRPAATNIVKELVPFYKDGIYHFILYGGEFYKRTRKPKCEEIFKVKVLNGRLKFLTPDGTHPCSDFFD